MKKLFALALLLCFLGCKPNELDPLLVGEWLWTGSSGGFAGMSIKPKVNERYVLQFKNKGELNVYKNDTLRFSGKYKSSTVRSIYSGKDAPALKINNVINHQPKAIWGGPYILTGEYVIQKLDQTTLSTADNLHDGFGSSFNRIK